MIVRVIAGLSVLLAATLVTSACDPPAFFTGNITSLTSPNRMCIALQSRPAAPSDVICGDVRDKEGTVGYHVGDLVTASWTPSRAGGSDGHFFDLHSGHY
jgi:hypothetical protein